jgi:hypothetical protein
MAVAWSVDFPLIARQQRFHLTPHRIVAALPIKEIRVHFWRQ